MTSKRERSLNSTSEFRFQKWRLSNNGAFIYTHHRGQICSDKEMFKWPVLKCNRLLSEFTFSLHNDLNSYKASGNMSPSLLRWNNDVGRGGGRNLALYSAKENKICVPDCGIFNSEPYCCLNTIAKDDLKWQVPSNLKRTCLKGWWWIFLLRDGQWDSFTEDAYQSLGLGGRPKKRQRG